MNLYLTMEQYLSQSLPYLSAHLTIAPHQPPLRVNHRGRYKPLEVASATMYEDGDEEHRVEVRDGRSRADDETPRQALEPVGDVVL